MIVMAHPGVTAYRPRISGWGLREDFGPMNSSTWCLQTCIGKIPSKPTGFVCSRTLPVWCISPITWCWKTERHQVDSLDKSYSHWALVIAEKKAAAKPAPAAPAAAPAPAAAEPKSKKTAPVKSKGESKDKAMKVKVSSCLNFFLCISFSLVLIEE